MTELASLVTGIVLIIITVGILLEMYNKLD